MTYVAHRMPVNRNIQATSPAAGLATQQPASDSVFPSQTPSRTE